MRLWTRFRMLSLWNRIGVLGAICSVVALPIAFAPFVVHHAESGSVAPDPAASTTDDTRGMHLISEWGLTGKGRRFDVEVLTDQLVRPEWADLRLFVTCWIADAAIDWKNETRIQKSEAFRITGGVQSLALELAPELRRRVANDEQLNCAVMAVNQRVPVGALSTVADIERNGGVVVGQVGMGTRAIRRSERVELKPWDLEDALKSEGPDPNAPASAKPRLAILYCQNWSEGGRLCTTRQLEVACSQGRSIRDGMLVLVSETQDGDRIEMTLGILRLGAEGSCDFRVDLDLDEEGGYPFICCAKPIETP